MPLLLACALQHLLECGPSCKQSDSSCCCCQDPSRGCAQHPPQTSHPRHGQPASWVMPSVIVPHPLRPNKRVLVELPVSSDAWTANDTKNAIEMALLAKYGCVAPCVDVPQHQHGQDQAVVKAGESAHNETMDWDVAKCNKYFQRHHIMRPCGDLCSTWRPGTWRRPLRGGHSCSIDLE